MLALLAAGFVQLERFSQEHKNKTVEMVLDLASATEYARTSGQKLDDFLKIYHTAGVRSLALSEQKWEELESRGVAGLFSAPTPNRWTGRSIGSRVRDTALSPRRSTR